MSLLNCEIYQRGKVFTVADTELILMIAHLIVGRKQQQENLEYLGRQIFYITRSLHFCQNLAMSLEFVLYASYISDSERLIFRNYILRMFLTLILFHSKLYTQYIQQ